MVIIIYFMHLLAANASAKWSDEYKGRQYYVSYNSSASFENAKTACSSLDPGALLVTIKTEDVQRFLESILRESDNAFPSGNCGVTSSQGDIFYIGLKYVGMSGVGNCENYEWVDGTKLCESFSSPSWTNWPSDGPVACYNDDTCVVMSGNKWYLSLCSQAEQYICERSVVASSTKPTTSNSTPNIDEESAATSPSPVSTSLVTLYIIIGLATIVLLVVIVVLAVVCVKRRNKNPSTESIDLPGSNDSEEEQSIDHQYEQINKDFVSDISTSASAYMNISESNCQGKNCSEKPIYANTPGQSEENMDNSAEKHMNFSATSADEINLPAAERCPDTSAQSGKKEKAATSANYVNTAFSNQENKRKNSSDSISYMNMDISSAPNKKGKQPSVTGSYVNTTLRKNLSDIPFYDKWG